MGEEYDGRITVSEDSSSLRSAWNWGKMQIWNIWGTKRHSTCNDMCVTTPLSFILKNAIQTQISEHDEAPVAMY